MPHNIRYVVSHLVAQVHCTWGKDFITLLVYDCFNINKSLSMHERTIKSLKHALLEERASSTSYHYTSLHVTIGVIITGRRGVFFEESGF